jgi:hypothetical protein
MIHDLVVGECTPSREGGIGVVVQLVGQGQCEVLDKMVSYISLICGYTVQ